MDTILTQIKLMNMNLYDLFPKLNGYKTQIGSIALMLLGLGAFVVGVGNLIIAAGHCLQTLDFQMCYDGISSAWFPLVVAAGGLTGFGIGHKMEKAKV